MPTGAMNIKSLFQSKQAMLESKLSILLEHPVSKGEHCEGAWIDFFRSFLPANYSVDKGFIFDSGGNVSEQIDVIIHEALYSPLIFGTDAGEKFITVESVYAVFESKPRIEKKTLEYTNKKIESVLKLKRSRRGVFVNGKYSAPRELATIIGGILAIDSISKTAIKHYLLSNSNISIGCAISKGAFLAERNAEKEILKMQFSDPNEAILSFFYIILDSLYKLGTVAGIDIRDYAEKTIDSIKLSRSDP